MNELSSEVSMDLALVSMSATNEVPVVNSTDVTVPNELENYFCELVEFEDETRNKRKEIVDKVADCIFGAGITNISSGSSIYNQLFLWYIKYGKFDTSSFHFEENRSRFQTMYELELAFPSMTTTTCTTKQVLLRASRAGK